MARPFMVAPPVASATLLARKNIKHFAEIMKPQHHHHSILLLTLLWLIFNDYLISDFKVIEK